MSVNDQPESRPQSGDRIANGAIVLGYTHQEDAKPGGLANGIALCHWVGNSEPLVVWRLIWHPDYPTEGGSWQAGNGDYFTDLGKALGCYHKRGGRY